ncbi:MAG: hypothetical protein JSW64_00740 [Candidatus Zixiibacteriota bacterium]|nr:MAG: hypothetical protein JSW64_00740 [candidate division Zixibacteria bacterium]
MERFTWFYHEILTQAANIRSVILSVLRKIPFLTNLSDQALEWVVIGIVFIAVIAIIYPLIKWSAKVAVGAAVIAGALALFTSMSFWGLLPFTGLGIAVVLFSNKFQTE